MNRIADEGVAALRARGHEVGEEIEDPDGIVVRSARLHDLEFGPNLKAIARAGAGVNNIPVERCTERGIIVFNTPGSNANSVKELVVAGLLLSSRRIVSAIDWVRTLDPTATDLSAEVEANKSRFAGPEIAGKTLGVVGLGAIGVMVANIGEALGMNVIGHDPFLSVESAWGLSRTVRRARSLDALLAESDYVTLHAPLNDNTRGLINADRLRRARSGVRILNFARGGLVDDVAMHAALETGGVSAYVTDFPAAETLHHPNVISVPHLGASTPEAETNSAIMAARQLAEFIEHGNVRNAVNLPDCELDMGGADRLVFANRNIPNMVGQVTTELAAAGLNISDMLNRHRGELAYNIVDLDGKIPQSVADSIAAIEGVVMARVITNGRSKGRR